VTPESILTWLSIGGVLVGFVGALISQVTKTSVDIEGTSKKLLTPSGKWAMAISIVGFAGSFSAEMVKAYIGAQERAGAVLEAKIDKEHKRDEEKWRSRSAALEAAILKNTNDALAQEEKNFESTIESRQKLLADNLTRETRLYGRLSATTTPLTRLTIKIIVDHVPGEILNRARAGIAAAESRTSQPDFMEWEEYHEAGAEDEVTIVRSVMDQQAIQPTVNLFTQNKFAQQPSVLVLGLDERYSAVIGIGWVDRPEVAQMDRNVTFLPSGILIGEEIEWRRSYEHLDVPYLRLKKRRPKVDLTVMGDALVLSVDLDLTSIDDGILRCSPNAAKTAALSDRIELFAWTPSNDDNNAENVATLPLDANGIHDSIRDMDKWNHGPAAVGQPTWMRSVRVRIIPNDATQIAKDYVLSYSSEGSPVEGPRGDDETGYIRVWHGHAVN
jgi:hypothetical protein